VQREPLPGRDYQVNAGWIAYTKTDAGGVFQVWTRSPAGLERQVSALGTSSSLEALAPDGSVVFQNGSMRYTATPTGDPVGAMSTLGRVIWRDGRFVVLLGRGLYYLTP
jgi:hypothetical protein